MITFDQYPIEKIWELKKESNMVLRKVIIQGMF